MADSLPDTRSPPGTVAVPLSIAISLASIFFAAGSAYFLVTSTAREVDALRALVAVHIANVRALCQASRAANCAP